MVEKTILCHKDIKVSVNFEFLNQTSHGDHLSSTCPRCFIPNITIVIIIFRYLKSGG